MKKKYAAIAVSLALVLAASTGIAGCTSTTATSSSSGSAVSEASASSSVASDTIYGEIKSVSDGKITLNLGTWSEDDSEMTLTGKTQEITVTDDTKVTMQGPGGNGSEPPEKPDSDSSSDSGSSGQSGNQPPEMPDSDNRSDGSDSSSSDGSGSESSSSSQSESGETDDSSSSNQSSGKPNGQPPAKPSDNSSGDSSNSNGNQPPEKPDSDSNNDTNDSGSNSGSGNSDSDSSSGDSGSNAGQTSGNSDSSGQPGGAPDGGNGPGGQDLTVDNLQEGTKVSITLDDDGNAETITLLSGSDMGGGPGGGGSSAEDVSYTAEQEISEDTALKDTTVDSTGTDEEGILVDNGATATLSGLTINRTSDDSTGGDNSSFYGVGASVLTTDGTTYLSNSTITSDAKGGAGVFSYGDDSTVYVADTTIKTSQDTSGGIHVAGGGKLYAYDVTAETEGESSAAIRSDRGSGTMVVDGGTYTSRGTGSPAVYSTADITINDATLTSENSEAACIEGLNSIRLYNTDLTGNMPDNDQNDCTWNVILYQSMSGDSEEGNSTFTMDGGTLTAKNGGMFYTTNTESTFVLNNVKINYADENDFFLKVTGNSNARGWGESGSNGADSTFTAIDQEMQGDIIWDSISQLDFYMTGNSTLTGAVTDDESNAGDGGDGYCNVYIEKGSTWTVTGDSTLTALYNAGTIQDSDGKTVTVKGTDGTVYVEGDSEYTITVSKYSTDVDTSGAGSIDDYSSHAVEKPSELS